MVDMGHLINLFEIDVINVKFDKDIKRYENKNPIRRRSLYDHEIIRYRETFDNLEENYYPDQNEFNLAQNDAEVQRAQINKNKKALSMVD